MSTPSLRQLRTLLEVVHSGSISAAARTLNLTQPAASQQIRALERMLGGRLVERAGGRVIATAAGAAVLAPAQRAIEAADEAAAAARAHKEGATGRVRIGTGATACIHLLPPVLTALRRRLPGLEVVVATGNTPEMLARLAAGELDAALVTRTGRLPRTLLARHVLADPLLALVPLSLVEADLLTDGRLPEDSTVAAATLARYPLILYERGGSTREIVDGWFGRAGIAPRPVMELGSVEAIKVLVAGGFGVSVLPRLALTQEVAGTLAIPLRPRLAREIALVLRREKVMERGLRLLIEALDGATPQADPRQAERADSAARI